MNTGKRCVCMTILDRIAIASKTWSGVISRWDDLSESDVDRTTITPDTDMIENGLSTWLSNTKLGDDSNDESWPLRGDKLKKPKPGRHTGRTIVPNTVELYLCSFCYNPSAVLKKCSGCGKVRYVAFH